MQQILLMFFGALIYRFRGGMPITIPYFGDFFNARPLAQVVFALPYAHAVFESFEGVEAWIWVGVTLAATTAILCKGHGNTMDLGDFDRKPEWYEIFTQRLKPRFPSLYWYDFFAHSFGGFLITLMPGILAANPVLALSGLMKGPAYALSKKAGAGTEGGELLTGAFLWGAF